MATARGERGEEEERPRGKRRPKEERREDRGETKRGRNREISGRKSGTVRRREGLKNGSQEEASRSPVRERLVVREDEQKAVVMVSMVFERGGVHDNTVWLSSVYLQYTRLSFILSFTISALFTETRGYQQRASKRNGKGGRDDILYF